MKFEIDFANSVVLGDKESVLRPGIAVVVGISPEVSTVLYRGHAAFNQAIPSLIPITRSYSAVAMPIAQF